MKRRSNIVAILVFLISYGVQAQDSSDKKRLLSDTISQGQPRLIVGVQKKMETDSTKENTFKPDPMKVVWMAAIIPGYGQILNRKYWKLPLVYGGFLGCVYAISWNTGKYQTYKTAYRDIIDSDPTTNTFLEIIPKGYTINSPGIGGIGTYTSTLKTKQDFYRRYRDLSIIATIGYYAITMVDAYVDAQLYDFDISPDLTMHLQPTLIENRMGFPNTLALQCSFNLK